MAALAHNPIRKSWKREWPVIAVENPVSKEEKLRYARIASDFAQRAGVNHWEETKLKGSGRVAEAFITESDEKVIKSPATTTPYTLYMFLHEAGHHFYDHVNNEKPYHVEEYEATHKALEILEENRIALSCEATEEAGWNVEQAIKKDRKKGIKIEPKAEELVTKLKGCTVVNPNPDIQLGDFVKIVRGSERFWVRYTGKSGGKAHGVVDNKLLNTSIHGLRRGSKVAFRPGEVIDVVKGNPAVSAEQYRLAQAVLSGTARESSMPVSVAREIVERTPARLRNEYGKYTNPGGVEVELTKHHHFLPFSTKKAAETMKRLLQAEGVKAAVKKVGGEWGVDHTHANPSYGMDLDLETTMAPAWMYYNSKQERDAAARMYEGRGKQVVLGHSMFGFKEGGGKKWRLRGLDHRGNPKSRQPKYGYILHHPGDPQDGTFKLLYADQAREANKDAKESGQDREWVKVKKSDNPQPAADDMYASFHGEPSDETIEIADEEHYHSHLAALGELVELKVKLVNGGTAVIGFETGASEDEVDNPFWSSARSTASKISGSVLAGLKRAAASRKERARWIPYATTDSEVRAQAKAGYLEAHDVSAKVERRKVGGVFSRKYKFDVVVDREQLRDMFKKSAAEKKVSRGTRPGGSKPSGAYKGYQIREIEDGFAVPKLDPSGKFASKRDAKEFIDYTLMGAKVKNPGPFHEAGKLIGRGTRATRKPMNDFIGAAGKVGGYLDDELGRALNPSPSGRDTGPAYLTSNEDGSQLFIVGGDQSLDLPGLGITGPQAEKELVTIGQVTNIVYHAHKIFSGKREEYDYTHKLSEDTHGPLPVLIYDRINQQLKLSGGVYHIPRPMIGTSQGITD